MGSAVVTPQNESYWTSQPTQSSPEQEGYWTPLQSTQPATATPGPHEEAYWSVDMSKVPGAVPGTPSPQQAAGKVPVPQALQPQTNVAPPLSGTATPKPIAEVVPHTPTFGENVRAAVGNSAIGRSIESTMPGVADALGIHSTAAEGTPDSVQDANQLVAPEYLARGIGRANPTDKATAAENVLTGVGRAVGGLTTPGNLALMAAPIGAAAGVFGKTAGAIVPRLVSAGFTLEMLKGLYGQSKQFREAMDRGDTATAQQIAGEALVTAPMAALSGTHAIAGGPKIAAPGGVIPPEPNGVWYPREPRRLSAADNTIEGEIIQPGSHQSSQNPEPTPDAHPGSSTAHPAGKVTAFDEDTGLPIVDRSRDLTRAQATPGFQPASGATPIAAQGGQRPTTHQEPQEPTPDTHYFSAQRWAAANPGEDVEAAKEHARNLGYEVIDESPSTTNPDIKKSGRELANEALQRSETHVEQEKAEQPGGSLPAIDVAVNYPPPRENADAWRRAAENRDLAKQFQRTGLQGFSIEPPYRFGLSEQGNISRKTGQVQVNANAMDPEHTITHEVAHDIYYRLPDEDRATVDRYMLGNPQIEGSHVGGLEERISDHFANVLQGKASVPPNVRQAFLESNLRPVDREAPAKENPSPVTAARGSRNWTDVERSGGYLNQEDDLAAMAGQHGDRMLLVKDVNGGRHIIPASATGDLLKNPRFSGNIRNIWLAKNSDQIQPARFDGHTLGYLPELARGVVEARPELRDTVLAAAPQLRSKLSAAATTAQPPQRDVADPQSSPSVQAYDVDGATQQPPPGSIARVPRLDLTVDPRKFQYKLNPSAEGITNQLTGKRWNEDLAGVIQAWRDPESGKTYVVNGHHRVEMARRFGVHELPVRFIDAPDAKSARAVGALQNIAEGRGNAVDAAKFFRDSGFTPEQLESLGVSMGEATSANGISLAGLSEPIFTKVATGKMPMGRAIAVGRATGDHSTQDAILKMIEKAETRGRNVNDATVAELARFANAAPSQDRSFDSLFGKFSQSQNLALEKAEISSYIQRELAQEKRLFGSVASESKAKTLSSAGNTIKAEENARISAGAAQAIEAYNRLSTRAGAINDALDQAARSLADGHNSAQVKQRAYERIRAELSKTLGEPERGNDSSVRTNEERPANPRNKELNALPGMERHIAANRESAAEEQGRELTQEMRRPAESVERSAGELERKSPLFSSSEANPQKALFNKQGLSLQERDAAAELPIEVNAARATGTLLPKRADTLVPEISLNANAYALLHNEMTLGHQHWSGIILSKGAAGDLISDLRRMASSTDHLSARRALRDLAEVVAKASDTESGHVILYAGKPSEALVREEQFHAWQMTSGADEAQPIIDAILDTAEAKQILNKLREMGYPEDRESDASELAAKAISGELVKAGATETAQEELLRAYINAVAKHAGVGELNRMPSPTPLTKQLINEARKNHASSQERLEQPQRGEGYTPGQPGSGSSPRSLERAEGREIEVAAKAYFGYDSPSALNRIFPAIGQRIADWIDHTPDAGDVQRAMMRETRGEMDRRVAMAAFKLRQSQKEWRSRSRDDSMQFWNAVEQGKTDSLPQKDRALADLFKSAFERMRNDLQQLKPEVLQDYIENYFPHLWKQPSVATKKIKQALNGKRSFAGEAAFLKQRTIPTMQDGLNIGLEPRSWNPVDSFLAKYAEMAQFLMAHQTIEAMKEAGTAKFVRVGERAPDGWRQLDDRIATVMGFDDEHHLFIRGHYYAPEEAARVFNNFVSRGIAGRYAAYDIANRLNQNLNALQLGISAFHATTTSVNAATSDIALGLQQLTEGKPLKAGVSLAKGAATLPSLVATAVNGSRLMREYLDPGSYEKFASEAKALAQAGGRVKQYTLEIKPLDQAINAWRNRAVKEGVTAVPAAVLHSLVAPVMDFYVPRMKIGAFYNMAHDILDEATRHNWDSEKARTKIQEAWDSVDNRFGQMVYDNLFWHRGLRDALNLAIRSVGWNFGDLRELGGAVVDTARTAGKAAIGQAPAITSRMAFALALPMYTALVGGVLTYLWTGQRPETWKDYFYPKTADGQRHSIPGYMKDVFAFSRHPAGTVLNKLAPIWTMTAEAIENRDFYGTEIRHKDDPTMSQFGQFARWAASEATPFSFTGAAKLLKGRGAGPSLGEMLDSAKEHPGDVALGQFGFQPAPSYIQNTESLNLARQYEAENHPPGTHTQEQADHYAALDAVRAMYRTGDVDDAQIQRYLDRGNLTERDVTRSERDADIPMIVTATRGLNVEQFLHVFEKASPDERDALEPEFRRKQREINREPDDAKRQQLQNLYDSLDQQAESVAGAQR